MKLKIPYRKYLNSFYLFQSLLLIFLSISIDLMAQLDNEGLPIGYCDGNAWHFSRNQYNQSAYGDLVLVGSRFEWEGVINYYKDENNCIWRLETRFSTRYHNPDLFLKFTRRHRNGISSHEIVVSRNGQERDEPIYENVHDRLLTTTQAQQSFNYYSHLINVFSHDIFDVYPHNHNGERHPLKRCSSDDDGDGFPEDDTGGEYDDLSGGYGIPNEFDKELGELFGGTGEREDEDTAEGESVRSVDPNDIIGDLGFGEQNWISKNEVLPYKIRFENHPDSATAPAQEIVINFKIDENLEASTLQLGSFGFGSFHYSNAVNKSRYKERLNVVDSVGVYVDVEFKIDKINKLATWTFQSIDAKTGLPSRDPFAGFLPVNDTISHKGEGYVNFIIKPKSTTNTGDLIHASADIIFDYNNPISTNIWTNTIDASPPESNVISNITPLDSNAYKVSWMGVDVDNGSGLKDYCIYYSDSTGIITEWIENTTVDSAIFYGDSGNNYQFYSTSRDNVNNIELKPEINDAVLVVNNNTGIENSYIRNDELLSIYPNPTDCCFKVVSSFNCTSSKTIIIFNTNGEKILEKQFYSEEITIDLSNNAKGIYYMNVTCDNKQASGKVVIQ